MRKPGDVKTIHRFQPFSERIQSINVDISRKVEKRAEVPEEETFFEEGLLKWRDLNQTAHFTSFYEQVQGCTQMFAQLLHNEKKVVDLLIHHIQVKDSMALEALLDLVVQLARDLQKDFYPHLKRFFAVITSVLNNYLKSWQVIEQSFSCLSYLFKMLWRIMVEDMKQVMDMYRPFFSENCRDYMRRFAAESLSYLMRKVKDRSRLFNIVFSLLEKHPDLVPGVGNLIFEMVKGPKTFLHSCAEDTLSHLLHTVCSQGTASLQFQALKEAFHLISEHVDQANTGCLWRVIQKEIVSLLSEGEVPSNDSLECIASVLYIVTDFKHGCLLPRPCTEWCTQTVVPLIEQIAKGENDSQFVPVVLDIVCSMLMNEKTTLETSTISLCLSLIYNKDCIIHLTHIFRFTESLFQYSQFEKDVLRRLLLFCHECLAAETPDVASERRSEVLAVLSKLVLDRRGETRDGVYRPVQLYPLNFTSESDAVRTAVKEVIAGEVNEGLEIAWVALTILPHCNINKDDYIPLLREVFSSLKSALLGDIDADLSTTAVASHCLQTCLWVGLCPEDIPIIELLRKYPSSPHVLRMCSLYMTYQSTQCPHHTFTHEEFGVVYPLVKENLSSHRSQVRLLTLRILSLYPAEQHAADKQEVEKVNIFSLCLKAEEQQSTLENYREKLRHLRNLHYDLVQGHLPVDGSLDDLPLRYLSAVLYVNLSTLWPETLTLIESHGNSLSKETLWPCYGQVLESAAQRCRDAAELPVDDTMECEEPTALLEVFNRSQSFHDNNSDRADFCNHRQLLWKAMQGFAHKCEQTSKLVVELFFTFLEQEYYISAFYDAPTEDISKVSQEKEEVMDTDENMETHNPKPAEVTTLDQAEQGKKRSKVIYQTFITKLTLFAKFQHPMRISQEPRLSKLYNDLLLHRDMPIQQAALKCLMTYKKKHLQTYYENFERLLNDSTFRTELTLFSIDSESTCVVKEEDRPTVMPVLLRILYGRMLHSTGKETKGRGGKSDLRRTIVLSFLAGCREHELEILLDLIMDPFHPLLEEEYLDVLDLKKAMPPRRVLGVLSTVIVVMEKLGHLLTSHLNRLLSFLVSVLRYAVHLLDKKREEINSKTINSMKVGRQTAIKCIAQLMERHSEHEFDEKQVNSIFDVAVWPQLPRLSFEGTSAPTSLLILIETWTHYRRYLPLLLKVNTSNSEFPLGAVMKLLASPLCKPAVGSLIMDLVENILDFHSSHAVTMETDSHLTVPAGEIVPVDDSAGSYEVGMLIPHLNIVINYIKDRVSKATLRGTNQAAFPMKELNILSTCSQYVDAPELCSALLSQLLPFLTGGTTRLSEEIQSGIVRTLGNLAKKTSNVDEQLCKLLPLCSTLTQRLVRMELVKMFISLKDLSNDCKEVASFVQEVNAYDTSRIEEPDYDSRLGAFREIAWWDYDKCPLSLVLAMIHNSCFTLRHVDDMALRDSASATLQVLVKKMPSKYYDVAVHSHLAPLIRSGIQVKHDTIRSEFLALLRDMVNSKPDLYNDMAGLANEKNIDDDFWENIRHIQVSRRLKGLNRLMRHLDKVQMKSSTLTKYLLPLVFSFIKDDTDYQKKNAMVDVCIATVGALCKHLPWSAYKSQLKVSLNLLNRLSNNKMAIRLLCTILDSFHYDVSLSTYVETQIGKELTTDEDQKKKKKSEHSFSVPRRDRPQEEPISRQPLRLAANQEDAISDDIDEGIDMDSETLESKSPDYIGHMTSTVKCPPDLATSIHSHVIGTVLPTLHQTLSKKASSDDLHKDNKTIHPDQAEVLRIPLAVAIVTLLQKISTATLDRHLPPVLMKVCYFLKSRAEDIRDAARQTLAKMLAVLGVSYMATITDTLKASLTKGYQVSVLGFSLHYILNQNVKLIKPGDLSACVHNLVYITMQGLFGSSSHDKDIDKQNSSKEHRRPQYYEMFALLAKFSTASTIAVILLPLKEKLDTIHKVKDMSKLRQSLNKMAEGLLQNVGLTAENYLKFTHSLISESVSQLFQEKKSKQKAAAEARQAKQKEMMHNAEETFVIPAEPRRAKPLPPTLKKSNKHVLVEFGMKLFHMLLKKAKISFGDETHARMVDPFVQLLVEALTSEDVPVIIESLICLTFVIKFKALPSLVTGMEKVVSSLFDLLKTYSAGGTSGESFELCQLCFRLISMILKTCGYYQWTEGNIEILLTYAESDILDHNRQATAFSLLKAIISRKLLCTLLYEVVKKVEELSVKSESADVRLHCRQVVLQFLLDYPLGKSLPKHINFYLDNLDYEAQHGRESIYEMLGAMLTAFPQKTVHAFSSTLFISLAQARANDEDEKCRKLAALAIKTLLGRVERNYRTKLFVMGFKWLQECKVEIVQMAAQIIGIFVEVECDSFSSRFNDFLPVLEKLLQPQLYVNSDGESDSSKDLQLYHIILLTMKIVRECPRVLRLAVCDKALEHIRQHMLHPHAWVRYATAQVFGLVFSTYNPSELVAAFLSLSTSKGESASGRKRTTEVQKQHRSMTFMLKDTRQRLRDFTADFCTQLSSRFMDEDFASQIVKNLVFLVKVIQKLPETKAVTPPPTEDMDDSETSRSEETPSPQPDPPALPSTAEADAATTETVSIDWLIRRLGKVATFEATNAPRESVKRSNVFKCLAAIAVELGPQLQPQLKNILPPIHRELTMVKLFTETEALRNLAGEVSNLLKSKVGAAAYSAAYAAVHQAATQRKAERKRKLAQQAVMNPSIAANKKMRLHAKKHTAKRHAQKTSRFRGDKSGGKSKKKIARDMAILQ